MACVTPVLIVQDSCTYLQDEAWEARTDLPDRSEDVAYYSQVNSPFRARRLAALLLALAAFGVAASSAVPVPISQPSVWARQRARRSPQGLPEQRESADTARAVRTAASRRDPRPPAIFIPRWVFQRPPPGAPAVHA